MQQKPIWPSDLPGIIGRITPEDGAQWVERDANGLAMKWGPIRADWEDLCLKAAVHMREVMPGIKERMERDMPDLPWLVEKINETALKEAIAFRARLIAETPEPDGETT